MSEDNNIPEEQEQSAAANGPPSCPEDTETMYEGEVYGLPAWVCPYCDFWLIRN